MFFLFLIDQDINESHPLGDPSDANPLHVRLHIDMRIKTEGWPINSPSPSTV